MKIRVSDLERIVESNLGKGYKSALHEITLVQGLKSASGTFSFEACDLSEIEFTKGFKALREFNDKAEVKQLTREISAAKDEVDNMASTATDEDVAAALQKYEFLQNNMRSLTDSFFGDFAPGLVNDTFIKNITQLGNIAMLGALGPGSVVYCSLLKTIVKTINSFIDAYTDTSPEKDKEIKNPEFNPFYNALERAADKLSDELTSYQRSIFSAAIEKLNLNDREKALFKFVYIRFANTIIKERNLVGKKLASGDTVKVVEYEYIDNTVTPPARRTKDVSYEEVKRLDRDDFIKNVGGYLNRDKNGNITKAKLYLSVLITSVSSRGKLIEQLIEFSTSYAEKTAHGPPAPGRGRPTAIVPVKQKLSQRDLKDMSKEIIANSENDDDVITLVENILANLQSIP